ncbi:c-type cytochrome [Dyadobacter flavalbus]|uniref:C-type cytochrome n=1 Tax=Dyadobacter flavalbus TaxID=2579942 RepID=A0A5M8QZR7_9BACT|nr:c-type cytochrome [Dyadobacter flavalbus]KAA6441785.1 c-type cytochrome [Dyadobacter flavalbus]
MYIPFRKDAESCSFSNYSKTFVAIVIAMLLSLPVLVHAQDSTAAAGAAPAGGAGGGDAAKGEALFKNNCAQCHAVTEERVVGPGLKGASARHDFAWLSKWVRNSQAVIAAGDPYAVKIYNEYAKAQMTSFPNLSDDDIKGIFAYIDKAGTAAPAAAAAPAAGGATSGGSASAQGGGPSDLFVLVLAALVVVMLLVLGVLLVIVSLLSKAVGTETENVNKGDFMARLGNSLKGIAGDPAIRSATIWIFVLLVLKATIDGAYNVGVQQGYAPKQPIAFSHKLHAGEYKIDCNYCHTGVNRGKSAHIPSANICMNCHGVIKKESPEIQKIYTSIENNQPIEWVRVHNLPDLAYFNHAQHVNVGGLECQNCHGDVEKMEVIQQRSSLTMGWCIDCHRKTEVNTKDNKYYDKLVQLHSGESKEALKVADIGGLECSKCHY